MKQHKKLMLPGPVDVFDETLEALSQQVPTNFTPDWSPIYWETVDFLQQIFQTKNDIAILTGPGSGAIEAGVASLFMQGEKVAMVANGPFANRAIEIMQHFGVEVIPVPEAWAQDATASVLAERAELDKALAAETTTRISLLEKFLRERPNSLLHDQARYAAASVT